MPEQYLSRITMFVVRLSFIRGKQEAIFVDITFRSCLIHHFTKVLPLAKLAKTLSVQIF